MRLRNLFFIPLLALFGCAANDPYEYEKQQQAKVSEPNAMTRAVMGLPSPDHREPLTGPMGGGGYNSVDHYMKQQEAALKKELQDSGVRIERVGGDYPSLPVRDAIGCDRVPSAWRRFPWIFRCLR